MWAFLMEREKYKKNGEQLIMGKSYRPGPASASLSLLLQFGFTETTTGMPGFKLRRQKRKKE